MNDELWDVIYEQAARITRLQLRVDELETTLNAAIEQLRQTIATSTEAAEQ